MPKLKCVCGGDLLRTESDSSANLVELAIYEEYICSDCELVWKSCGPCDGELHGYDENNLNHIRLNIEHKGVSGMKKCRIRCTACAMSGTCPACCEK